MYDCFRLYRGGFLDFARNDIVSAVSHRGAQSLRGQVGWRGYVTIVSLPGDCHVALRAPRNDSSEVPFRFVL